MASAPSEPRIVCGRVDSRGRLVSADPELAALQTEAGSHVGRTLALPQVAAIARLARKLRIPVARRAIAAGCEHDVDLWVRAAPEGDDVILNIERMSYRSPSPPRLTSIVPEGEGPKSRENGGAWSVDEQLRLTSVSASLSDLLSIAPAEGVGQPLTRLFRLEESEQGELPILAALAARTDFSGQKAVSRGEPERSIMLTGHAVTNTDGSFAGFAGHAVPVDNESGDSGHPTAVHIDTVLDEALRTPIDRIIDSAERMADRSDGPLRRDYAAYAADISTAARHLLAVLHSMNGDSVRDQDRVDVARFAGEATVLIETAAEENEVLVALEPSGPLIARGEQAGVIQILVNLVGNAVRYSPRGGTVSVSFESADGLVSVSVADTGRGVEPEDQERIFERFEQAGESEGSAGLGLAISRRLARSMGGDIRVDSEPGEGARFTLILPAA